MAQLLNAPDDKTIVWTRGTTESINMVAQCYARPRLQPGDEIIVSVAEHHANLVPWLMVAQQTGAKVVKLPLNAQRLPDVDLSDSGVGSDVERYWRLPGSGASDYLCSFSRDGGDG